VLRVRAMATERGTVHWNTGLASSAFWGVIKRGPCQGHAETLWEEADATQGRNRESQWAFPRRNAAVSRAVSVFRE
jgi:hypothetical protein